MTKRNLLTLSKNQEFNHDIICGIDEAGRGPVLGPMVICGVCYFETDLKLLDEIGVKDSKKLTPIKRSKLAKIIKDQCYDYTTIVVSAQEIDEREKKRITLNKLEEIKMAEIIETLKPKITYIDAADVNEARFGNSIKKLLKFSTTKIISKHKADDLYPIVSASSIIAKVTRDNIIEELKRFTESLDRVIHQICEL